MDAIAITGLGIVSALGSDVAQFHDDMIAGSIPPKLCFASCRNLIQHSVPNGTCVTSLRLGIPYATEWHCPGQPLNFSTRK